MFSFWFLLQLDLNFFLANQNIPAISHFFRTFFSPYTWLAPEHLSTITIRNSPTISLCWFLAFTDWYWKNVAPLMCTVYLFAFLFTLQIFFSYFFVLLFIFSIVLLLLIICFLPFFAISFRGHCYYYFVSSLYCCSFSSNLRNQRRWCRFSSADWIDCFIVMVALSRACF